VFDFVPGSKLKDMQAYIKDTQASSAKSSRWFTSTGNVVL